MKTLAGISASPGIVIGKVFLYLDESLKVPKYEVGPDEIQSEFQRFKTAVEKSTLELHDLKSLTSDRMNSRDSQFLDSHLLMLSDPEFISSIESELQNTNLNVEWVLYQKIEELIEKLSTSQDQYLRERVVDFLDIARRVFNHLLYRVRISLADLSEEVILVTHSLLPSDALQLNKRYVKGMAMDAGGKTSHTAILARSFEIPAVLGLSDIVQNVNTGDEIILDGNTGVVIIQPDEATKNRYIQMAWYNFQLSWVDLKAFNKIITSQIGQVTH